VAALAGSASGVAALVAALVAGAASDRIGPRAAMLAGLALSASAYLAYPLVRSAPEALAVAALAGAGIGTWLTMQSTLLAALAPPALRHRAFAQQRVAANIGLGLGGFCGGVIVTVGDPGSFTRLFVLNAVTFGVYGVVILRLRGAPVPAATARTRGGYRAVLADRAFAALAVLTFLLVAAGVALLASLLPVYARNEVGASERAIGLLFLLNSLFIIGAQLRITRAHEGRRRMPGLALTAAAFAAAWLLVEGAGVAGSVALLVAAVLVFAVGECLYDTIVGPLVADLARDDLRGRSMAVSGFAWQLGFIAGPALGGVLLALHAQLLWPVAALVLLSAAAGALRLEQAIPATARVTPAGAKPSA
jgi:MFS family permease